MKFTAGFRLPIWRYSSQAVDYINRYRLSWSCAYCYAPTYTAMLRSVRPICWFTCSTEL